MGLSHLSSRPRWAAAVMTLALAASPAAAQRVRQITEFLVTHFDSYVVDDSGSVTLFLTSADPLGTNPDHVMQVFRKALPGGEVTQLTAFDQNVEHITVSDDGGTILFSTGSDPLGTNADGSAELFLADGNGGSLVQLTDHPADGGGVGESAISGDASKAVFVSDGDLTGGNAARVAQVFVIGTDGTGLIQLTHSTVSGFPDSLSISDDGQRIVFVDTRNLAAQNPDGSEEIFRVFSNGVGLKQSTVSSTYIWGLAFSGSGETIAYSDSGDLYWAPWTGVPAVLVTSDGSNPSITDDGLHIYFDTYDSVRLHETDIPDTTDIWTIGSARLPVIAGSGQRLLFHAENEGVPFLTHPDSRELLATDGDGLFPEQVVEVSEHGAVIGFDMTADGQVVVFPWGEGDQPADTDLYVADTASGQVTRLLDRQGSIDPAIADDGISIVFWSSLDVLPTVCPGQSGDVFRINSDGTGLEQLIPAEPDCHSTDPAGHPVISSDGSFVVFQAQGDPSGGGNDVGAEVFGCDLLADTVSSVTDDDDSFFKTPRIDGTGTWIVYMSGSNITGQNANEEWEVFRIRTDGTDIEQLTMAADQYSWRPDISADGQRIVYQSTADPLGANADHNIEIFLYDATMGTTQQLTQTTSGDNEVARISPNGQYVAFLSTSPWVSSSELDEVYRLELGTSEIRLASAGIGIVGTTIRRKATIDVDDDGSVAFRGFGDLVGRNSDRSLELWLAEFDEPAKIEPGSASPTLVRWDPLPWALRYDVIRGDVSSLSPGTGGTVDLGSVVCLEDNSEDARTLGDEDAAQPVPGQVFFYLFRGWGGEFVGDGSWGEGSGEAERVPGSGSCTEGP